MTKQAWFCPACRKHHATHVETCPGAQAATVQNIPNVAPNVAPQGACGCASPVCRERGCQAYQQGQKYPPLSLGWFTPGLFGTLSSKVTQ